MGDHTDLAATDWNADNVLIGDGGAVYDRAITSIQEELVAHLRRAARFPNTKRIDRKTLEWWKSWHTLSKLKIIDYIYLLGQLPKPFASTTLIHNANLGGEHYRRLHQLFLGKTLWLLNLLDYDSVVPKPKGWDGYELYAWQSKARLDLTKAVYNHLLGEGDPLFTGWTDDGGAFHKPFFGSAGHLWFWGEVANCIRVLKNTGLSKPLHPTEVKGKTTLIEDWGEDINSIKKYRATPLSKCKSLKGFLENLDLVVLGDAMKGNYSYSFNEFDEENDPLDLLLEVERWARDIVKNSELYQGVSSYQETGSPLVQIHITKKGRKLPQAEGFKPRRPPGRPPGTFRSKKK